MERLLIRHVAGSRLFGTNLPTSDTDYKEIYIPSKDDILLGKTSMVGQSTTGSNSGKNTAEDTDTTRMSVQKYLHILTKGDMNALETLFSINNPECLEFVDPLFMEIYGNRDKLVSKAIYKSLGYLRSQCNRYVVRGERMEAVKDIVELLKDKPSGARLCDMYEEIVEYTKDRQFASIDILTDDVEYLNVCNRKNPIRCKISDAYHVYNNLYLEYGERTKNAMSLGGSDLKGIAHAVRISYQMIELLKTGLITLPRPEAEYLKSIRLGNEDMAEVTKEIDRMVQEIEVLGDNADSNSSYVDSLVKDFHMEMFKDI